MKSVMIPIALALGLALPAAAYAAPRGCDFEFKKQGLCASLEWRIRPTPSKASEFRLRFWDPAKGTESGPYVRPEGTVGVKLWMPSMGHGSRPVTVTEASGTSGVYDANNVIFIMGGAWDIWVQLKKGSEILEQAKVEIDL